MKVYPLNRGFVLGIMYILFIVYVGQNDIIKDDIDNAIVIE